MIYLVYYVGDWSNDLIGLCDSMDEVNKLLSEIQKNPSKYKVDKYSPFQGKWYYIKELELNNINKYFIK